VPEKNGAAPNFKRFFDTLENPLRDLAKELGVPEDYLLGHAAHESSYLNDHNFPLNNPFGYTAAGKNNLSFGSIAEAIAAYRDRYGKQIKGATSDKDFAERIQGKLNGKPVPGWYEYNSKDKDYEQHVLGLIHSIPLHKPDRPEQPKPVK
jgi:hypothetical protein